MPTQPKTNNQQLSHTIQVGIYFVVAILALFVFFNISGLATAQTVSYAFIAFAFVVFLVMPRQFPRGDASDLAMPKTTRYLGGIGMRITTTFFLSELVAAGIFINFVTDSAMFAFFVQAGLYLVYLSYAAYQSNEVAGDTPQARALARGKSRGSENMPKLRSQAHALVEAAAGTRFSKEAQHIEAVLKRAGDESFEGTLELEQQISGFLFELTTLLKEDGDELTMRDCVRMLDMLLEQRNQICK